jgi:hypothetical protein
MSSFQTGCCCVGAACKVPSHELRHHCPGCGNFIHLLCGCQLVEDECSFRANDIVCSVCDPQTPRGVNTPSLSRYWDIGAVAAKRFSPSKLRQGARILEFMVALGGASTLQQIGVAVVKHLSPSKPCKVVNVFPPEVPKNVVSDGSGNSLGAEAAIGKSEGDSNETPHPGSGLKIEASAKAAAGNNNALSTKAVTVEIYLL